MMHEILAAVAPIIGVVVGFPLGAYLAHLHLE